MDDQTLATAILVCIACLIAIGVATFLILRRVGSSQESWSGMPSRPRPLPLPNSNGDHVEQRRWSPKSKRRVPYPTDDHSELAGRLKRESEDLDQAGFEESIVKLPAPEGDDVYCVTVSSSLPTKCRTANLYLVCDHDFPFTTPRVYAEVLSATRFNQYGQARTTEVELQPLQTLQKWNWLSSSLLDIVREAFGQLDEEYRTTDRLSGFLNRYGELVRLSNG